MSLTAADVTHRQLQHAATKWLLKQAWCDLAGWEIDSLDAVGVQTLGWQLVREVQRDMQIRNRQDAADAGRSYLPQVRRYPSPRVQIVEVKRTRSDLLQDLKRGKMLTYEPRATHCVLAVTDEAMLHKGHPNSWTKDEQVRYFNALADLGLPVSWGICRFKLWTTREGHPAIETVCLRRPRATPLREGLVLGDYRQRITESIARSLVYRVLNPGSPVVER